MYAVASAGGGKEDPELLLVKKGSRLHAKMLSKEAAAQLAVPSFRVYYPVASAGAVPFLWESQPGTPKHGSSSPDVLPPLTPPPSYSYYAAAKGRGRGRSGKSHRRPGAGGLLGAILPWLRRPGGGSRRTTPAACSSWSSSSWSSSSSSSNTSSTMSPVFTVQGASGAHHHRRAFSAGAADYDDAEEATTPRCFWTERECSERRVVKGCGVAAAFRNALARVFGRN